jgi:hypothetical protein
MALPFVDSPAAAMACYVRLPNLGGGPSFGFTNALYNARNTGSFSPVMAVYVRLSNTGVPSLYYDIPTSASGTAVNSIMLAQLPAWTQGQTYHVEMFVDHSAPVAICKVYVNGALQADVTYDRDRITNEYRALSFDRVAFAAGTSTASARPFFSNILVYLDNPAGGIVVPIGPHVVDKMVTPDANLTAGPADDATRVTISGQAWTPFDVSDLAAGGEILGAFAHVRLAGVDGQQQSDVGFGLELSGVAAFEEQITITPGQPTLLFTRGIGVRSLAELNSAVLKLRSVS